MKTEKPTAEKIKKAVDDVLSKPEYKKNVEKLRDEFRDYNANKLSADLILNVIK